MIITTSALATISTYPMSSMTDPPSFSDPTHHPVVKAASNSIPARDNQLFVSPMVEGVILIQNFNVSVIFFPKKTQDIIHDPDGSDPILIGAVGSSLTSATPVSVPLKSLFQDFLCLEHNHSIEPIPVPHGEILDKTFFSQHPQAHNHSIPYPEDTNVRCLRLPVVLPKVKGLSIVEGSIKDPKVIDSLVSYHPIAAVWIRAHLRLISTPPAAVTKEQLTLLGDNLIPDSTSTIPITLHHKPNLNLLLSSDTDPASLRAQVTTILEEKLSLHKQSQPQMDAMSITDSLSVEQQLGLEAANSQNKDKITIAGRSIESKHQRSINIWRLFLSGIGDDRNISLPTFTDPFLDGYCQSTITENTRLTSAAMREHDQRRSSDTRDFLHKLISDSQWNNATTALFLNGVLFDSLLDELLSYLQTSISFITFLPIPPASVNPSVQNFLHQSNMEHLEALVGESNEKKRKINLRTFQGGLQDTPTHILTGLANFESKLSFMVDYSNIEESHQPLIVRWVNQLANLYSSRQFMRFYDKHHKALPWISHTMVTQVQIVISSLAKISKSYLHHNSLKRQKPLHASILRVALKTFNDVIDDIKRSIRGSGLGCFATPPPSYVSPDPPPSQRFRKNPPVPHVNPSERPERRRGWLIATGPYRWPQNLHCQTICNKFAQIDSSCSAGHSCPQKHLVYPYGFDDHDKKIIYDFVTNNNNTSFPAHIKFVPHTSFKSPTISTHDNKKTVTISPHPSSTLPQSLESRE